MKKLVFALISVLLFSALASTQEPARYPATPAPTMTVTEVQPGMKGVAYTVFEGARPEPMGVEVLGVLRNANGPRGDIILVRLRGEKAEYTGVVAGMSGSPVYIDGKLLGAIAFRIGAFSKEAIAGVTPISQMLEINEFDHSATEPLRVASARAPGAEKTGAPGVNESALQNYAQMLQPIEAPFVFSGFSENAVKTFAPQFAAAGIVPVMGVGGASSELQPEPMAPGSAVSAVLVRGDMDIAATCTVTYMDKDRLLACGHPLLQHGLVDMPMTKATVVTTLATPLGSFKIINTNQPVGAFVQDRHTGILGRFNKHAEMIPVTLTVRGLAEGPRVYHYEVLNNARLTPVMMMITVFSTLQGMNAYGEETTYAMKGRIQVQGYPEVRMANLYSPMENMPTSFAVAISLGEQFNRIFSNQLETPKIAGVSLDFDMEKDRRSAILESARTDVTEARPGDEITVEAVLWPYRGERQVRRVRVRVPASAPKGSLRLLVSDGETLDRIQRPNPMASQKLGLRSTIALLNNQHLNDHLYVSVLEPNPQATVQDKVMPAMPLSVMNVMEGLRATQEMVVFGESAMDEVSTPVGYALHGSQIISLTIK